MCRKGKTEGGGYIEVTSSIYVEKRMHVLDPELRLPNRNPYTTEKDITTVSLVFIPSAVYCDFIVKERIHICCKLVHLDDLACPQTLYFVFSSSRSQTKLLTYQYFVSCFLSSCYRSEYKDGRQIILVL